MARTATAEVQRYTFVYRKGPIKAPPGMSPHDLWVTLENIRQEFGGELRPADVVEASRSPRSPLHDYFDWNNATAGEKYRRLQARHLITAVRVVLTNGAPETHRIYVSIRKEEGKSYITTAEAMNRPAWRAQVLARAKTDLLAWRERYRDLDELRPIFQAIDQIL